MMRSAAASTRLTSRATSVTATTGANVVAARTTATGKNVAGQAAGGDQQGGGEQDGEQADRGERVGDGVFQAGAAGVRELRLQQAPILYGEPVELPLPRAGGDQLPQPLDRVDRLGVELAEPGAQFGALGLGPAAQPGGDEGERDERGRERERQGRVEDGERGEGRDGHGRRAHQRAQRVREPQLQLLHVRDGGGAEVAGAALQQVAGGEAVEGGVDPAAHVGQDAEGGDVGEVGLQPRRDGEQRKQQAERDQAAAQLVGGRTGDGVAHHPRADARRRQDDQMVGDAAEHRREQQRTGAGRGAW